MLRTDSLKHVVIHPALNAAQRISAENIHVVCFREQVSEFLHLNRRLCVTLRPQQMHAFSENDRAGCSDFAAFAAFGMRSSNSVINRTGSGMPLSMNFESLSAASNAIYLSSSMALPISKP